MKLTKGMLSLLRSTTASGEILGRRAYPGPRPDWSFQRLIIAGLVEARTVDSVGDHYYITSKGREEVQRCGQGQTPQN